VKEQDWGSIHQAMGRLAELDFWVDDTPSISIFEVRTKARRQLKGKTRGLVVVDYLQLMQPPNRRSDANRTVEIGEISRGLKILAKELGVPVLALSQLSRAVEQRAGKRPQLSDLRESGSIEQDADVVMFIDRNTDHYAEDQDGRPAKGTAELIVAKHRNGPTGSVPLVFIDRYAKFTELASAAQ
jgi:replicative DNA helicase